jgi:hypothetical protein
MDPAHFDQLSRRLATGRRSRRHAVRGLGAAGLASALFGLRRRSAAADCPYLTDCRGRCIDFWCTEGFDPFFPIPGGPKGTCWDWGDLVCKPCGTTWDDLNALCNASDPRCEGKCRAV